MIMPKRLAILFFLLISSANVYADSSAPTALDAYVRTPDEHFNYSLQKTVRGNGYTTYVINLTSQQWLTKEQVDRPIWRHWLTIIEPDKVRSNKALLLIYSGIYGALEKGMMEKIAQDTGSVVACVEPLPEMPLTFTDKNGKSDPLAEDTLIADSWARYLRSGDTKRLVRLPIVKSVVSAMDAVSRFCANDADHKITVDQFVLAGQSKRGWAVWLAASVDKRVVAVIPMVIDILNVVPSLKHQYESYGHWEEAMGDYESAGVLGQINAKQFAELIKIEDPYSYKERLTMPKYIINSADDEFFPPDSSRFYFDDLLGEKYLRYVPNSSHHLYGTDVMRCVESFYWSILEGKVRPRFSWKIQADGSIRLLVIDKPLKVKLWQATNPEGRDFRLHVVGNAWTSKEISETGPGVYIGSVPAPAKGWTAFFLELTYNNGDGSTPLKFTTSVSVVPDRMPFEYRENSQ